MRSAIGKEIDMAALASKHEHVRAAGNMGVNARGDIINEKNQVIVDNNQRINSVYNKTLVNTDDNHSMRQSSVLDAEDSTIQSELTADEPIQVSPLMQEEPDIITPEEMELLHDDEVAEDDFSVDDIVKVVSQKP
jgi:hypothetical protein